MTKDLAYYMALDYPMLVWHSKEDACWYARIPLLNDITTHADTWEALRPMVEDLKEAWFGSLLEDQAPIPEPADPAVA